MAMWAAPSMHLNRKGCDVGLIGLVQTQLSNQEMVDGGGRAGKEKEGGRGGD